MLSGKLSATLAGVAVAVGALAISLLVRWVVELALIAEFQIDITINVSQDKVMDFFIQHPDMQSLHSQNLFSSPWNVVSTVQMTESITRHTLTLTESVPVLNHIDHNLYITCDRERNIVTVNSTGKALSGAVTLCPEQTFMVQDVDGVQTRLVDHFRLYGNRFLTVFKRTAYEVGKEEHRLVLENLKKTLEGT